MNAQRVFRAGNHRPRATVCRTRAWPADRPFAVRRPAFICVPGWILAYSPDPLAIEETGSCVHPYLRGREALDPCASRPANQRQAAIWLLGGKRPPAPDPAGCRAQSIGTRARGKGNLRLRLLWREGSRAILCGRHNSHFHSEGKPRSLRAALRRDYRNTYHRASIVSGTCMQMISETLSSPQTARRPRNPPESLRRPRSSCPISRGRNVPAGARQSPPP